MSVFVHGKLRNPLNGSWGGWRKHARLAKEWRERTAHQLWGELRFQRRYVVNLLEPKRITFTAHVGGRWDDDNLPAAIKPCRDALQGLVIQSDAGDAGHVFVYQQVIDRQQRGVTILVETL